MEAWAMDRQDPESHFLERQARIEERVNALTNSVSEIKTTFGQQMERLQVNLTTTFANLQSNLQERARLDRADWTLLVEKSVDRTMQVLKEQQAQQQKEYQEEKARRTEEDKRNEESRRKTQLIYTALIIVGVLITMGDKVVTLIKALAK